MSLWVLGWAMVIRGKACSPKESRSSKLATVQALSESAREPVRLQATKLEAGMNWVIGVIGVIAALPKSASQSDLADARPKQ